MRRYGVVDGAEKLHDLDFVYHIGMGRYRIKSTNLLIFVHGINANGTSRLSYFLTHKYNTRSDLTFEQFFERLPDSTKEDVLYNLDVFR